MYMYNYTCQSFSSAIPFKNAHKHKLSSFFAASLVIVMAIMMSMYIYNVSDKRRKGNANYIYCQGGNLTRESCFQTFIITLYSTFISHILQPFPL